MDKIARAAKMAGQWWAERLDESHADKRDAFAIAVEKYVNDALRGKSVWDYFGTEPREGNGVPVSRIRTEVDYDPKGPLLSAVREVISPSCRGAYFSADGILPRKHSLVVSADTLKPKEGYGNWTDVIIVPDVEGE